MKNKYKLKKVKEKIYINDDETKEQRNIMEMEWNCRKTATNR